MRIECAEAIVRAMPDPPEIRKGGDAAWYKPSGDLIQVPCLKAFHSTDAFYATLFYEFGHERTLNPPGVNGTIRFGSQSHGREELVAEFASANLCAHAGPDYSLEENSMRYIDRWFQAKRDDPKATATAAAQAQRAADYVLRVSRPKGG